MTGFASLSTGGPGCVPLNSDWVEAAADLAVTASGGHRTGIACPPQKAVREAASRLFHHPHASASRAAVRATLDLTTRLGAQRLRAHRCWLLAVRRHRSLTPTAQHPLDVMAGLGPATYVLRPASLKAWIPGTSPGMTARELETLRREGRRKPSPPLWGRAGEGGVSANRSGSGASTPSLALPHKGRGE